MNDSVLLTPYQYCDSFTHYSRRKTREVKIGIIGIGGNNPIRVQSMTTVDTMDTMGSIEQSIRMIKSGCELIRITAPSIKEAQNLKEIKKGLRARGYNTPIVADIHFTPHAAELAARIVEKVRINPGNYADKKKFKEIEYTDESYRAELDKIREKFIPLINICKDYGTAMRIGTNHGSLSDRIMSRYGDTSHGMVESALEFVRICEDLDYYDLVISMKSSNPQVMVQAYRLLVCKLNEECLQPYPLHLGVTEAGEGEDGRIKSAIGIGTLLEDGLGDTIRVSLTEEPELEMPVAHILVSRYFNIAAPKPIPEISTIPINSFEYTRRKTHPVNNLGGSQVPRVIADFSRISNIEYQDLKNIGHFYLPELDKWHLNDLSADYIYSGAKPLTFTLPSSLKEIIDAPQWEKTKYRTNALPLFDNYKSLQGANSKHEEQNFLRVKIEDLSEGLKTCLASCPNLVLLLNTDNDSAMLELRRFFFSLMKEGITHPVVVDLSYANLDKDHTQIYAATDLGGLLVDGMGDGIMFSIFKLSQLSKKELLSQLKNFNHIAFGILQGSRTRISKAEYISCPSCGRTLFNLQETTAMIRKRTDHLKGVKIGIMGCIVNGPGEMADADYGYVGSGKDKITLYKGKEIVKKSVPSEHAVDELIEIIRQDKNWIEPKIEIK